MKRGVPSAAVVALAGVLAAAVAPAAETAFRFPSLDRAYHDVAEEIAPIRQGPLTLRLRSPSNVVEVESHQLRLVPLGDGRFDGRLALTVRGGGELVGEIAVGTLVSPVEDRLVLRRPRFEVPAQVAIERRPEGFAVTPLTLPSHLEVAIQSQLGNRLVGWCEQLGLLLLAAMDCGELESSVSSVRVPLPAPGETYLVPAATLTSEERRQLDGFLGGG